MKKKTNFLSCNPLIWLAFLLVGHQQVVAFASPSPIPPPPSISVPVWSLASLYTGQEAEFDATATSMNIVTFATPVSVAPPKLWAVSLYTNTMTRCAFLESKLGVLQLLKPEQAHLVPLLGKKSGFLEGYSKSRESEKIGFPWVTSKGGSPPPIMPLLQNDKERQIELLPQCAMYIKLKLLHTTEAGDHDVAICEAIGTGIWDENIRAIVQINDAQSPLDPSQVLYTDQLRKESII